MVRVFDGTGPGALLPEELCTLTISHTADLLAEGWPSSQVWSELHCIQ